ncbi:MAG TPA: DUF3224 domain-containing protein [Gemmatimonadaceae bacterium]|nr:DUF3224 domain-containing protein [Gemmatimonadaceae bacterium]
MPRVTGNFEVTLNPLPMDNDPATEGLGRMSIDKQYHGELEAVGKGQMLTGATSIKNSAGYVAVERVTGTLRGRKGSFILQHNGIMTRGAPSLAITVVPDSATDQLDGLRGTMSIRIEDGKHFYDLTYTLGTP